MTNNLSPEDYVTTDEICACAHLAERLLSLGERDLAFGIIEAIYCMVSNQEGDTGEIIS
jgi:hypothetical protein